MQTKIKTITEYDDENLFDERVNSFTQNKTIVATQTHVIFETGSLERLIYTAVIYYKE